MNAYETLSEAEGRHLGMGKRRACCPLNFVRMGGLEPPRRKAPDPKSGLSTNFNTSASSGAKIRKKIGAGGIRMKLFAIFASNKNVITPWKAPLFMIGM